MTQSTIALSGSTFNQNYASNGGSIYSSGVALSIDLINITVNDSQSATNGGFMSLV